MTDVGKISLGVEIDASDLSARLGEAVRRAIAPALAEINRELEKTQREYNETARASEKSSAIQEAGAKAVADAVQQVGQNAEKSAAKTRAASGVTSRSINAITRAIEKQTAALSANTAARAANAAAPDPATGGGGSRGRGSGGGGPPGGVNRGGFMQGGKGRFGFLTSPVGVNLIAGGIGSLPAATTAVMNLVASVQQLGQAGLALPGIYGAAGASIGVAVLGFKGMGDAVKALNDAAKSGDPKDLEKATEAMKDMDPAAQAVAKSVSALSRGPLLDLRKQVQGRMFRDFAGDLDQTANKVIPRLSGGIGKVADAWNGTLKSLTGAARDDRNLGLMDRLLGNTADAQTRMNKAVAPLSHAILTLTAGSSDVLPRLADGLEKVSTRFDNFITKADSSGRLQKWINDGLDGARQLGNSFLNIGKTITGLTQASGTGGFLRWLEDATNRLQLLVNSTQGQTALGNFFRDGREQMGQWGEILKNLLPILKAIYEASRTWSGILLPFLEVATHLLGSMPGLLQAVLIGFLAWKSIQVFKPILGGLDNMVGKLGAVENAALNAGDAVAGGTGGKGGKGGRGSRFARGTRAGLGALGSTRGLMGLGLLAGGTIEQQTADDTSGKVMGALSTIGGGALTGAAIGSVIPGVGTAIGAAGGAAIGTVLAGVNFLLGENAQKNKEAQAAQEAYAASVEQSRQALVNLQGAQKEVNDSLLAAKGDLADAGVQAGVQANLEALPESLKSHYGDQAAKGFADSIAALHMSNAELAQQVTGSQPIFDALENNLKNLGPDGFFAAQQLQQMRDQILGMQTTAQTAGPALEDLAAKLHLPGASDALAAVKTAVESIPQNVPINTSMPNGQATLDVLSGLGYQIDIVNGKPVVLNADSQAVKTADDALSALGIHITHLPTGEIQVAIDQAALNAANTDMNNFFAQYTKLLIHPTVDTPPQQQTGPGGVPGPVPPGGPDRGGVPQNPLLAPYQRPGGADGMVVPGYAPRHDIVNAVLAPGEGVLIPEAVRGLGGAPGVYALNSRFRRNLSTRFYADGGVNPDGTPILPGLPPGPESELDVLKQIRDLLAGKGGTSAPLNATATNTASMSTAVSNAADAGQEIGPFGTPLKKKNRAYDAAKGALEALGFDAETIIGSDPTTYKPQTSFASGAPGAAGGTALPGAGVDFAAIAASLSKFALSGNLADVAGLGLNANSPVITAITSARNKKKGGLDDQAISDLVTQVVTGGYTGVLDEQNSSLIKSLQSFRDSSMKKGAIPGTAPGTPVGGVAMGTDQGSIARAIYAAVTSQGYSPAVGQAAVQAALLESGLSTSAMNAGHNSLFQTSADKGVGSDPASQIQWLLGEMARQGGPAAANADPLNFFADRIERGGYPGSNYNQFAAQAQALLGSGQIPTATTYPLATPGGTTVTGQQGLQPAAQNLLQVIESTFPQIKNIGGVRPDSLPYHPSGRALDIMIPGAAGGNDPTPPDAKVLGDQIYSFLMANASQLGIDTSGTLWQQKDHYNHIHAQLLDGVQQFTNAGLASPGMTGGLGGSSAQYGGATPVYVVNMGGGGLSPLAKPLLDGLASGGSEAAQNVIGDLGGAMTGAFTTPDGQRRPDATLGDLVGEQNPMALAAALGFHVEDFTREGGIGAPNIQQAGGFDATGRLFSDTAGLMDRTMTSLNAQLMAMRDQIVDVITQMSDKLNKEALEPTLKAGVQNALEGLKDSVTQSIGQGLGTAAAPPIADAVSSAVAQLPVNSSGAASTGGTLGSQMAAPASTIAGGLFASGGAIWGGIPGKDSVPILAQQGEFVLDKGDVSRMGGISGVEHFRRALEKRGGIRHMATGGGVNVNDVVGAEFFGVSEVPIIGTIVNLLIRVLLKMIGVDIEARDTMVEMSDDFRSFRGDAFKAFDAQGRLLNDTSGLIERSSTSTETAAAERIRILKIVIQAIIKYLIEKVIVPIAKAVANSLIQAGASAAGASIAGAGGGPAGGIVSSVISSAGSAGVDIAAEVGTDFALAMSETIINMVGEGLMSQFGDQMTAVFGGGILANLFDPAGGFMGALIGGIMAIFAGLLGGTFGGAATMIPGDALFGGLTGGSLFDDGGMAEGQGFLPKASMGDELVLSPVETDLFSRFVSALERGGFGSGGSKTVNAPITVIGGRETANQVQDRLLKLMP